MATESVRMYVIRPTWPSGSAMPSYSDCATLMVRRAPKLSLREASCCSVLVVKGGGAFFFCWLRVTLLTVKVAPRSASSC